jgi:uncharacterized protein YggU (UPF0235/DUF167 family)
VRISVSVKTNSKVELVEKQSDGTYLVRVHVPPVDGKANERIRELLAEPFKSPKSSIEIVAGFKGKKKIFQVK